MQAEDGMSNTSHKKDIISFEHLFSSKECRVYLESISNITGFDLSVYAENGTPLQKTKENPICRLLRSVISDIDCPDSCMSFLDKPFKANVPATFKCCAKITNSFLPINYLGKKFFIVGKSGFASYEDSLEFRKIQKDNRFDNTQFPELMIGIDENRLKTVLISVHKSIEYLLDNIHERHKLSEKFSRFTSLVDTAILDKLSDNTLRIYRYVIDTIDYITNPVSAVILTYDSHKSIFREMCSTEKKIKQLAGLKFLPESRVIKEIVSTRPRVLHIDHGTEELMLSDIKRKTGSLHLFPIFIGSSLEGLICIFDKEFSTENQKIVAALRDYFELILENNALHSEIDRKLEEMLSSISDLSKSIAPLLNWNQLFQTILDKSIQLLKAEQGSLMMLNHETKELLVEAKKSTGHIIKDNMRTHFGENIAGKVLETGKALLVEDVEKDPRVNQKNKPRYKTKSFISIPLKIENRVEGVLNISDKSSGESFNKNDLNLIQSFIPNAAIAIERSSLYNKIENFKKLSLTDPLTGILNRRYLNNRLSEEISRFKRHKHSFSFLMLDIDGFKEYNDTFGHPTGDNVLKAFANTISSSVRNIDIVVRYGGDEFVVILPQTQKKAAISIANRLRKDVSESSMPTVEEAKKIKLTVSIGLSSFPEDASSIKEIFEKTDKALYMAKKKGRNNLVYF